MISRACGWFIGQRTPGGGGGCLVPCYDPSQTWCQVISIRLVPRLSLPSIPSPHSAMTGINLQSVPMACLASAAAGVAFHGVVQYIELDLILLHALVAASFLLPALIYIDINVYDSTLQFSTLKLACFAFGLTSSILIYRAFFHRLRRFPGPFAARLSKLYAVSLSTGLRYNIELQKLHQKYGDVVRTGRCSSC